MGSKIPKQFLLLEGRPLLMHTIERFYSFDNSAVMIVVLPAAERARWSDMVEEHGFDIAHQVVDGGSERFYSVRSGVLVIDGNDDDLVAIHDGVRPLVSEATIERCFTAAAEHGAAIPVIEPAESVRMITAAGSMPVNRSGVRLVQTPQVFRYGVIAGAYRQEYRGEFTDDATVAEADGNEVVLVEGNRENIKITTPGDLLYALCSIRGSEAST